MLNTQQIIENVFFVVYNVIGDMNEYDFIYYIKRESSNRVYAAEI